MDEGASIHVLPLPGARGVHDRQRQRACYFTRDELRIILNVYGRHVAAGDWRDYALDMGGKTACFAIHRRASEAPIYRVIKDPDLARRQGAWRVVGMDGRILKRGHDITSVLKIFED